VLDLLTMALLGPLKRLILARRPSYKRVSSSGNNRRLSNPPQPDLDDEYDGDDDIVHGGFVYCAFLMLGTSFPKMTVADFRTGYVITLGRLKGVG